MYIHNLSQSQSHNLKKTKTRLLIRFLKKSVARISIGWCSMMERETTNREQRVFTHLDCSVYFCCINKYLSFLSVLTSPTMFSLSLSCYLWFPSFLSLNVYLGVRVFVSCLFFLMLSSFYLSLVILK